jgi:hypothetical protein
MPRANMNRRVTQLDAANDLPLFRVAEERVGERRCIGRHSSKAPLPSPLPALRCGARESTMVEVNMLVAIYRDDILTEGNEANEVLVSFCALRSRQFAEFASTSASVFIRVHLWLKNG